MTTARRLVAQAAGATGVNVWMAGLSLVTTPYLLLRLGSAAYGVFAMVSVASSYLSNLEFGFGYATVRFLARARAEGNREQERAIFGTSLAVFVGGGLVAGGVLGTTASLLVHGFFKIPPEIQGAALAAFRIGAVILLASFLISFFCSVLQALGRFDWLNGFRAVSGTLSAGASVGVAAAGGGLKEILSAQALISAMSVVVLAWAVAQIRHERVRPALRWVTFREMAGFSLIVFLGGLAYQWVVNGPTVVLGAWVPSGELPSFTVPQSVVQRLILLMTSASLAFFPFASAASASRDRSHLVAVFRSHVRLSVLVMGAFTSYLVVFAEPLLAAWISTDFAREAGPCLRILSVAGLVLSLSSPPADVARALGRPRWVLVYTAAVAVLGVGSSLVLVPAHRAVGASWAFLLSLLLGTVPLLFLVAARLLGLGVWALAGALARPVLAVLATTLVNYLIAPHARGLLPVLLAGVGVTAVYVGVVFAWVLEPRERATLGVT